MEITSIHSDIFVLVYRTDPEAVEVTYSDMKCLGPEEYLKSPVINFFLQ
jgi:Ulp1 family protease